MMASKAAWAVRGGIQELSRVFRDVDKDDDCDVVVLTAVGDSFVREET
jgi:hypothetical protein